MIRDRGLIKWTSMMLPEHVKMLREWSEEDRIQERPELDEQELEAMNEMVAEAMAEGSQLLITHYAGQRHELLAGTVHHVDFIKQRLHIVDQFEEVHYINWKDVLDVRWP